MTDWELDIVIEDAYQVIFSQGGELVLDAKVDDFGEVEVKICIDHVMIFWATERFQASQGFGGFATVVHQSDGDLITTDILKCAEEVMSHLPAIP